MCEFDFISPGQKTVENRWDLTFENELSVDKSNFLFGHLGLSGSSALLFSVGGWSIVFIIIILLATRLLR